MHLYKNIASKSIYIYIYPKGRTSNILTTAFLLCSDFHFLDSVFKNVQVLSQTNKAVVHVIKY